MPKMKTHRGAAKRFNFTKSGKIKRAKSMRNHFLSRKSAKAKRGLRQNGYVAGAEPINVKKLIPYK